jgi:hypothetical protein
MLTENACFLRNKLLVATSLVYILGEESEPNLKINSYLSLCSSEFTSAWKNWSILDLVLVLLRVLSYVGLNIIRVTSVVPHHLWRSKIRSFLCHALRTELLLVSWLTIMI